jgi:hypothetical protein
LNLHLRQHSVQRVKHTALLARLKSVESKLSTVQNIVDKAMTAANKVKMWPTGELALIVDGV